LELVDGFLEKLPVPTNPHQRSLMAMLMALHQFVVARNLGEVLPSGTRVKVGPNQVREPDVVFFRRERDRTKYTEGADLVVEVVSDEESDRERDLVTKPAVYAKAKIPEYWIVDPEKQQITVYRLARTRYAVHGVFAPGQKATSALLPGFEVDVTAVLSAQGT
jgi:Uma2 family endonuclease